MLKKVITAVGLTCLSMPALAQECSQATLAEFRTVNDTITEQERNLRKLTARADGQDFRLFDLPEDVQAGLPPRPETPVLTATEIDSETVACDADGNSGDMLTDIMVALSTSNDELTAYEALLDTREAEITAAEDMVADSADVADAAPADEAEEPPATTPSEDDATEEESDEGGATDDAVAQEDGGTTDDDAVAEDDGETDNADVAEASTDEAVAQPMQDAENPALFRRVISLPDATLLDAPGGTGDGPGLSTFSVLYVYDDDNASGDEWLQVGNQLREGPVGWISAEAALPWSSMLVMQFTPRGQRERVLFFKDATPLSDIVNSPFFTNEARDIYADIDSEQDRLAGDPGGVPNWNEDLVAIEPETAVTFTTAPYLLPILDWREDLFDGLPETTLLQVAAIPAAAETVGETDSASFAVDAGEAAANDGEFRVGVVFVMDTTISMAPFIDRTKQVVNEFYDAFGRFETSAFVSFGFVGFRDAVDPRTEGVEYVTRIFQPLDPEAPARQVLSNLDQVQEADGRTLEFKEDAYAGLTDAIEEMDWSPYDARIVILVTDASARSGEDSLMRDQGTTAATVAANARAGNIAIVPIHLLTPANASNDDMAVAEAQYRQLGETGDLGVDKYLALDATSDDAFINLLRPMAEGVARAVLTINSGELLDQVEFEPLPPTEDENAEDDSVARIITNEIFRAQLESLAQVDGGDAPAFLAGWAADRDMVDPSRATLEVSVFLTRNQLSTLNKQLDSIVGAFRSGGDDPQAFFNNLQVLAAEMSTDPDAVRADDRLAVQTLLPTFLQNLPYKSEVLRLDRDYWSSLSNALREEFIENIEAKQTIYQDTFDQTNLWNDFGSDDPGLEATLILLKHLP